MATKPKRVTYNDPADDNADYLVPLQYDANPSLPNRKKSSKKPPPPLPGGVFGSIFLPITLLFYAGVPIAQFVIGLIYIGQCTVRQFVSIYMILSGFFGIAFVIVGLIIHLKIVKQASSASSSYDVPKSKPTSVKILIPIFIILLLFVIAWFFVGQVVVFEIKLRVEFFDPVLPEYCHGNLYKAAYILIFIDYLIFPINIILIVISGRSPPKEDNTRKTKRPTRTPRK
jgi:hypothetical protein